ncbi:HRDC domain-containing protein [Clostridium collagenovorans DSM 3089]|uniref:HRDC domain-containing protein n=1 Tax=Clostridium collagenovorans DSM 3089 TaxID=1121306 RepID=A0A1M5XF51_9CLOT|nr:HRDC domain-containing protein [Clostridium collagenovorans]SHH98467.1 HRDC domain-containing protein [Clostridium collagenovorans DSM 3089]
MGLFNKLSEPIFLKENSEAEKQLEKLKELETLLNEEGRAILKQDIKCLEYGIIGEKNIAFELKNSHMPMYILHDVYLEYEDFSAQIDYLVFTKKLCFVIECKNLYGNIEINNSGDFIRTLEFGVKRKKEGIYSPITQNQRHLELMKKIKLEQKSNVLTKFMVEKSFENINKSVVVLANPKTVLNAKFAKKEIKDKVIRADQLVKYIKEMNDASKEATTSDDKMLSWAKSYLDLHKDVERDYTAKYEQYKLDKYISSIENTKIKKNKEPEDIDHSKEGKELKEIEENKKIKKCEEFKKTETSEKSTKSQDVIIEDTEIFKELKVYRLNKSRTEKVKPYFIYNDSQLKDLISKMPQNKEELKLVAGFGEVKTNKYGEEILAIINKYECIK